MDSGIDRKSELAAERISRHWSRRKEGTSHPTQEPAPAGLFPNNFNSNIHSAFHTLPRRPYDSVCDQAGRLLKDDILAAWAQCGQPSAEMFHPGLLRMLKGLNKTFVFSQSDKKIAVTVSRLAWKQQQEGNFLASGTNFDPVLPGGSEMIQSISSTTTQSLQNILQTWYDRTRFDYTGEGKHPVLTTLEFLVSQGVNIIPSFFGIWKVHKETLKVRPVISCKLAFGKCVSILISGIINGALLDLFPRLTPTKAIEQLSHFVDDFCDHFPYVNDVCLLVSDFDDFYTNVKLELVIEALDWLIERSPYTRLTESYDYVVSLIQFFYQNSFFTFVNNDSIWKQNDGLAMGRELSVTLGELVGEYLVEDIREWCRVNSSSNVSHWEGPHQLFIARQVDDNLYCASASTLALIRELPDIRGIKLKHEHYGTNVVWNGIDLSLVNLPPARPRPGARPQIRPSLCYKMNMRAGKLNSLPFNGIDKYIYGLYLYACSITCEHMWPQVWSELNQYLLQLQPALTDYLPQLQYDFSKHVKRQEPPGGLPLHYWCPFPGNHTKALGTVLVRHNGLWDQAERRQAAVQLLRLINNLTEESIADRHSIYIDEWRRFAAMGTRHNRIVRQQQYLLILPALLFPPWHPPLPLHTIHVEANPPPMPVF